MKGQIEWYTLPENLLRAYQLFGDPLYRDFAMTWLYPYVWDKLAAGEEDIGRATRTAMSTACPARPAPIS